MCGLDDASKALNCSSICNKERLALRHKMQRCREKLAVLLNLLGTDSSAAGASGSFDARQVTLADLCANLYSTLYTSLLVNLLSDENSPLLNGSTNLAAACDNPILSKTGIKDLFADNSSLLSDDFSNSVQKSSGNFKCSLIFLTTLW